MEISTCFVNDLKELMLIHNVKDFDFTGSIKNGRLEIDSIRAIDFNNNELYPIERKIC